MLMGIQFEVLRYSGYYFLLVVYCNDFPVHVFRPFS